MKNHSLSLFLFAVVVGAACSPTSAESVASSREALPGPDVDVTPVPGQPHGGMTTSVAVGINGAGQPVIVEANNGGGAPSDPILNPGQWNQWAVSTNGGMTFPTTRSEAAFPWQTVGAPMSDGSMMSDGSGWQGGIGGPTTAFAPGGNRASGPGVVWTGFFNPASGTPVFAYVSLAESVNSFNAFNGTAWPTDTPLDVVVATSVDGGMTFGPASGGGKIFRVSDPQSSAMDTAAGEVFAPAVYAESPQNHVAWVTWDNINVPFNGGGKRPWIRKLTFDALGNVTMGPVTEVRIDCNLSCVKFDSQNIAAYCRDATTGAPATTCNGCVTGNPGCPPNVEDAVLMTFPRVVNSSNGNALTDNQAAVDPAPGNPSGCTNGGTPITFDVEWRAAISVDGGLTWKQGVGHSDGSIKMGEDLVWPNCIVPTAPHIHGNNRGRMAALHDDNGDSWQVFWMQDVLTSGVGPGHGQRIFQTVLSDDFTSTNANQEVAFNNAGGCAPHECYSEQFMPAASWSPGPSGNTIAVTWIDTQLNPVGMANSPQGVLWGAFSKADGQLNSFKSTFSPPGGDMQVSQFGPTSFVGTNGDTPWGDYNGMASDGTGTFFPAYGDNRCAATPPPLKCGPATDTHVTARAWMP